MDPQLAALHALIGAQGLTAALHYAIIHRDKLGSENPHLQGVREAAPLISPARVIKNGERRTRIVLSPYKEAQRATDQRLQRAAFGKGLHRCPANTTAADTVENILKGIPTLDIPDFSSKTRMALSKTPRGKVPASVR